MPIGTGLQGIAERLQGSKAQQDRLNDWPPQKRLRACRTHRRLFAKMRSAYRLGICIRCWRLSFTENAWAIQLNCPYCEEPKSNRFMERPAVVA